ncbi:MAG: hypothetical protein HN542_07095 [Flavobacteriales bacterium]|jgi:protein TonB|nr:hypothetical protein [Flavobacteriales bacterium]NCG29097.1 hypothetical protein [Bacteroidota bacterium]MBT3962743.1 hypothetical protein [Flavobacteriales bacterium]MBT4705906.1 hypothetical protein [Flavobacteriales bacterium]MBT4929574.1 hypothetical protein [Flavobacteriales bacterium]
MRTIDPIKRLTGMCFALGLSLCALEYGTPLPDAHQFSGDHEVIDLTEVDEVPVTIRKTKVEPLKRTAQIQPQVQTAAVMLDPTQIVSDLIDTEYPDFDFDLDMDFFFSKDSVEEEDPIPFYDATEKPEFPGGEKALYRFLGENLKYPRIDRTRGTRGRVHVEFVVGKNGRINPNTIKVLRAPSESLAAETVRVIELMPKWKPGKQRTKKVPVIFVLPVSFNVK